MSRLLLVSNRLPVTVKASAAGVSVEASAGGLATGLARPHERGEGLWLGWPGDVSALSPTELARVEEELAARRCVPLHLSRGEVARYYEGFSNRVLWPVLHSMPERMPFEGRHWGTYQRVNERFTRALLERLRPDDVVWVHDYQLLLVPGQVRARRPDARIGFFLHVPFPPADIFRTLPWSRGLLTGVLGADLIGFHTTRFSRQFAETVQEFLGFEVDGDAIILPDGRSVRLGVFPMGIDAPTFDAVTQEDGVRAERDRLRGELAARGERLILGVDRLDYTKGLPHRLLALRRLFSRRPDLVGKVRYVQVAAPSREQVDTYVALRHEVERLVGHVNGRYGSVDAVPVHFLARGFDLRALAAFYAAADVMLVTPLRDGMNLVAKEFVACRRDLDGVLILSAFAGAADALTEALIVHPSNLDDVVAALETSFTMPREERRRRMAALRAEVLAHDVHAWAASFLEALEETSARRRLVPRANDRDALLAALRRAPHRRLLLDYDGTLVPIVNRPELAAPDAELLELLRQLSAQPGTEVHVVSGRPREVLDRWLGVLPLALHAEHGLWSRESAHGRWRQLPGVNTAFLGPVRSVMERFATRAPGAFIENKTASLAWHYRPAEEALGMQVASELTRALAEMEEASGFDILPGHKVIEVRPRGVNKGRAVPAGDDTPTVAFGDDRTDEDMFAALPPGAVAVRVGPGPTRATIRLASPEDLRSLLWELLAPMDRPASEAPRPEL